MKDLNGLTLQDSPGHSFKVLPDGLIKASLNEFIGFFSTSPRRKLILDKYVEFRKQLDPILPGAAHLIDGSFVEDTASPGDIDTVIMFDAGKFNRFSANQRREILILIGRGNDSKKAYLTDAYYVPLAKPGDPLYDFSCARLDYWLSFFGKTRSNTPKGIIRLVGDARDDALSDFLSFRGMEV